MAHKRRIDVVRYGNRTAMQREMNERLQNGWAIVGAPSYVQPHSGCLRYILTGGLAFFWRPKACWVVTYQR